MFFCSTCKRVLGKEKRRPNRKTCSLCLKKSAKRARTLRARRHVETHELKLTSKKGDLRLCSSCKCKKALENFFQDNKSCEPCLLRRRKGVSAKMKGFKPSSGLVEVFRGEMRPPELPQSAIRSYPKTSMNACFEKTVPQIHLLDQCPFEVAW